MKGKGEPEAEKVEATAGSRLAAGPQRIEAKRTWSKMDFGQLAVLHWYALMVRPGTEFVVEALLERRGFVSVVPMRREWRAVSRYSSSKRPVEYPLAPRYVFVGFPDGAKWGQVFDLTMVSSVVGFDDQPLRMSGVEVALFLERNMFHEVPAEWRKRRNSPALRKGDKVDVLDGVHAGSTVKVHRIVGYVARVLVPLFGKVDLPLAILARSE